MTLPRDRRRGRAASALAGVALLALSSLALAPTLRARPVAIGRHAELAYGISTAHPHPMAGGGPRRAFTARHAAPEETPRRLWVVEVGRGRVYPPVVSADGTLFVASSTGVAGVSADGARLFGLELGLVAETPSLDPRGQLVVGVVTAGRGAAAPVLAPGGAQGVDPEPSSAGARGALVTLDPRGAVVGLARVSLAPRSSPLVLDDGSILAPGADGVLRRLGPEGPLLFELALGGAPRSLVAELPSHELVVRMDERLVVLDPEGRQLARFVLGESLAAGPAVATDGTIWAVTGEGFLFGLDPRDSVRVRAELDLRGGRATALALGPEGAVWVGSSDGAVVCVEPSGAVRFRVDGAGAAIAGITVDPGGLALVLAETGALAAVASTGRARWRVETGAPTQAAPVVAADGTIYVATLAGTLQAWR